MTTKQRLIATDQLAGASGVITYWALSGTAKHDELKAAWEKAGMPEDELIKTPSPLVALKRAVENVSHAGALVKPLADEDGYTVLRQTEGARSGKKQTWQTMFSAFIAKSGKVEVWVEEFDILTSPDSAAKLAAQIEDELVVELGRLHSTDISVWLVRMASVVHAVSLRDSGGFYFIPRGAQEDKWNVVASVLQQTSAARVMTIPAMASEQATLAVLTALTEEITTTTTSLKDALVEARMGKRALDTKLASCGAMLDKIGTYEDLLGERLVSLRDAVDMLKAKYTEAWLVEDAKQKA